MPISATNKSWKAERLKRIPKEKKESTSWTRPYSRTDRYLSIITVVRIVPPFKSQFETEVQILPEIALLDNDSLISLCYFVMLDKFNNDTHSLVQRKLLHVSLCILTQTLAQIT